MSIVLEQPGGGQDETGQSTAGGVAFATCDAWPRTDIIGPPTSLRIPFDTNSDGVHDHVASVRVRLLDSDGNGRFDRFIDRVLLDPTSIERADHRVPLTFCERMWRLVVKRAYEGL